MTSLKPILGKLILYQYFSMGMKTDERNKDFEYVHVWCSGKAVKTEQPCSETSLIQSPSIYKL